MLLRMEAGQGFVYPERLPGGARAVSVIEGAEALQKAAGIHWEPGKVASAARDAAIIRYSDGSRLWLVYAGSEACALADRMAEKIEMHQDELPYAGPWAHSVDGVKLYMVLDKRTHGLHVFWCHGGVVAWLELGPEALPPEPDEAMKALAGLAESISYRGG